jgi:hypothetical protein
MEPHEEKKSQSKDKNKKKMEPHEEKKNQSKNKKQKNETTIETTSQESQEERILEKIPKTERSESVEKEKQTRYDIILLQSEISVDISRFFVDICRIGFILNEGYSENLHVGLLRL